MSYTFNPRVTLQEYYAALSDPDSFPNHASPQVDDMVMGLVTRFTRDYLGIAPEVNQEETECRINTMMRIIEEGNREFLMQCLSGNPESDSDIFAVSCLLDTHATAALVKELIFEDRFECHDDHANVGVDLGSGTGILGAAMAIAMQRKKLRDQYIVLWESSERALTRSRIVLHMMSQALKIKTISEDLRKPDHYRLFREECKAIFFVSETISTSTPAIEHISRNEVRWRNDERAFLNELLCGTTDPFPSVLSNLVRETEQFFDRVRSGQTALFPNVITGDYIPGKSAPLRLRTSSDPVHQPLNEIGRDFGRYEAFSYDTRW
jgi:hypothetical protein